MPGKSHFYVTQLLDSCLQGQKLNCFIKIEDFVFRLPEVVLNASGNNSFAARSFPQLKKFGVRSDAGCVPGALAIYVSNWRRKSWPQECGAALGAGLYYFGRRPVATKNF